MKLVITLVIGCMFSLLCYGCVTIGAWLEGGSVTAIGALCFFLALIGSSRR
jgi:hypothetical protein